MSLHTFWQRSDYSQSIYVPEQPSPPLTSPAVTSAPATVHFDEYHNRFDKFTQSKQSFVHSREIPPYTFRVEERHPSPPTSKMWRQAQRGDISSAQDGLPQASDVVPGLSGGSSTFSFFVDAELWTRLHSLLNLQLPFPLPCAGLESMQEKTEI